MTAKLYFRTDPEFTVFALLAAWKLCPCHLHLHHNLHQVNNYTWFYIHQLCFHHRMNSWLTVAEVFMANPHFIPTFNIYYELLSRLFYSDQGRTFPFVCSIERYCGICYPIQSRVQGGRRLVVYLVPVLVFRSSGLVTGDTSSHLQIISAQFTTFRNSWK